MNQFHYNFIRRELMSSGNIFDIEEFAIYDGPGIRKVVFLKGCPLSCNWCQNPEGISSYPELMVSVASCIKCGNCKKVCNQEFCNRCGKCIKVCPLRLRRICGSNIEASELAKELLSDISFLEQNGGGITFSGGEPLLQSDFLFELVSLLKPLHLALETCGHAKSSIFNKAISIFDYIMLDVKLSDPLKHKYYTGVSNKLILKNLQSLCMENTPFSVRIPLIPGVNDDEEHMISVAHLIQNAPALQRVELLPYHTTAGAKYPMLGKSYIPKFDICAQLQLHTEILEKYNIRWVVL
jgi:pyruvate formate lyase activating enzyme